MLYISAILVVACWGIFFFCVFMVIRQSSFDPIIHYRVNRQLHTPRRREPSFSKFRDNYTPPRPFFSATQDSIADLLSLVNGHEPTARRLVDLYLERNPGRDEQWAVEKAIYDLERDRRN